MMLSLLALQSFGEEGCVDGKPCKKDCSEKFGAPYTILVSKVEPSVNFTPAVPPSPFMTGELSLYTKFSSHCTDGSSTFTAHVMEPHGEDEREEGGTALLDSGKVLYVRREDTCLPESMFALPKGVEHEWSGEISAALPEGADGFEFLAFPPGKLRLSPVLFSCSLRPKRSHLCASKHYFCCALRRRFRHVQADSHRLSPPTKWVEKHVVHVAARA